MKHKKIIMFFSIIILSFNLFAGGSSGLGFIIVDSETNIAYYSVSGSNIKKKGVFYDDSEIICNVQVNDIPKKKNRYIFSDNGSYKVNLFLFEEKIDRKANRKIFHSSYLYYGENSTPRCVENNNNITSEKVSNNIIIQTKNISTKEIQFWLCDKNGNNLKCIYKYNEKEIIRFYIDAKLQKIIFIKSIKAGNEITEFDY